MTLSSSLRTVSCAMALIVTLGVGAKAQSPASVSGADPHAGHTMPQPVDQPKPAVPPSNHDQHQQEATASPAELPSFVPRLTDADRMAAFPDLEAHTVHDRAIHSFVLLDQLERQWTDGEAGVALDGKGWIGRDRDRLWFRAEGDGEGGGVDEAQVHLLYGKQVSRWWDVVGGMRQDFGPGPAQTWAAIGIQGLAPYWFAIEATGYVGAGGRTRAKFEVEYELLLTNRLIAQPVAEVELLGRSDPERGLGAGLSTTDLGFRLRYELKPELAPYAGVVWRRKWGETADLAEAAGAETRGAGFVAGLRLWF